jgi:hypothetical protein
LSFPITPATIAGAAGAATQLARGISQSLNFDQVLRGGEAAAEANVDGGDPSGPSPSSLLAETVEQVRRLLGQAGIESNPPVQLRVGNDGQLLVSGDHPRAAEIESVLAANERLGRFAGELQAAGGPQQFTVRQDPGRT